MKVKYNYMLKAIAILSTIIFHDILSWNQQFGSHHLLSLKLGKNVKLVSMGGVGIKKIEDGGISPHGRT